MPQEFEFNDDTIKTTAALLVAMLGKATEQSDAIAYSMVRTLFDNSREAFYAFMKGLEDAIVDIKKEEGR